MLDLTQILQMIALLGALTGVMGFLWKIVNKQDILAERMTNTEAQLQKMVDIVTEVARQDERLNAMAATQSALYAAQSALQTSVSTLQTTLFAMSERVANFATAPISKRRG
jgi:uncharacterized protein (DUF3084 family)